jgi:hypothetical protein
MRGIFGARILVLTGIPSFFDGETENGNDGTDRRAVGRRKEVCIVANTMGDLRGESTVQRIKTKRVNTNECVVAQQTTHSRTICRRGLFNDCSVWIIVAPDWNPRKDRNRRRGLLRS